MAEKKDTASKPKLIESSRSLTMFEAIALAQSEMKNPAKNSTGKMPTKAGFYDFKFAGFDVITAIIRPACNKYGLAFVQPITSELVDGNVYEYLHTRVLKGEEEYEFAKMLLPPNYRDEKDRGKQITYFQRQQAKAAFALAGDDDVSDQSGDYTPEIDKFFHHSEQPTKDDKEMKRRAEEMERQDLRDTLSDRVTVAQSVGFDTNELKEWEIRTFGKLTPEMNQRELQKTIDYVNERFVELAPPVPAVEEIDYR